MTRHPHFHHDVVFTTPHMLSFHGVVTAGALAVLWLAGCLVAAQPHPYIGAAAWPLLYHKRNLPIHSLSPYSRHQIQVKRRWSNERSMTEGDQR
jgi:hypothetical protein